MALSRLFICMLFCFALVQVNAQDDSDDEKPEYKFDSTLKGGYFLSYKTDDSLQYLYLRKGNKLKLISSDDIGARQTMLGIVSADFDDYFLLTHTLHVWHQQDPIMCDLFEKKTMRRVMKSYYITWEGDYLLLHNAEAKGIDSMQLYNVKTKKSEYFAFPEETKKQTRLVNAIKIQSITPESLTLIYYTTVDFDKQKQKSYKRK